MKILILLLLLLLNCLTLLRVQYYTIFIFYIILVCTYCTSEVMTHSRNFIKTMLWPSMVHKCKQQQTDVKIIRYNITLRMYIKSVFFWFFFFFVINRLLPIIQIVVCTSRSLVKYAACVNFIIFLIRLQVSILRYSYKFYRFVIGMLTIRENYFSSTPYIKQRLLNTLKPYLVRITTFNPIGRASHVYCYNYSLRIIPLVSAYPVKTSYSLD